MYWNVSLVAGVHFTWSWIVTLDVLKFEVADVERLRRYGWIVTLDVLKSVLPPLSSQLHIVE